jgi:phosphatidylserine decarboxylase
MPIVKEGLIYMAGGAAAGLAVFCLAGPAWAAPFFLAALFSAWFFRDPRRSPPAGDGLLLSPADGRIIGIEPVEDDPDINRGTVVSIFMSVFNVHVNRCPIAGRVSDIRYHRGRFKAAFRDDAPEYNERNEVTFEGEGARVRCVQIAGLVARRIVCRLSRSESVDAGQKYGLIKFGSRVDVYIPSVYELAVSRGEKTRGGTTILARMKEIKDEQA